MSCNLTSGRIEPCKDSVGGLNAIYFVNFTDLAAVKSAVAGEEDVIVSVAADTPAYKYDIKGTSTFTQNIQSSRETGTTAFE